MIHIFLVTKIYVQQSIFTPFLTPDCNNSCRFTIYFKGPVLIVWIMLQHQKLVLEGKKLNTWHMSQVPWKIITGPKFLRRCYTYISLPWRQRTKNLRQWLFSRTFKIQNLYFSLLTYRCQKISIDINKLMTEETKVLNLNKKCMVGLKWL